MSRIYVAGPYSASTADEREANTNRAIDVAHALYAKGHNPFIPHLSHYTNERALLHGISLAEAAGMTEHAFWLDFVDREWLQACEALFYIAPSKGADMELAWAQEWRMPVYRSLDEVPRA